MRQRSENQTSTKPAPAMDRVRRPRSWMLAALVLALAAGTGWALFRAQSAGAGPEREPAGDWQVAELADFEVVCREDGELRPDEAPQTT